jgi:NADH-quinone oxidoreductase subunit L
MGGLKKELPVTYWTFLIGALAIAGVPGLAGFFSKDEILYRTYASGHIWLWVVGLLTSLLTAIYMFRLVFLAFHGERRVDVDHDAVAPGYTRSHLHDAPPAMAIALVVLAMGSVLAGYVGLPASLGGSDRFSRYLEPSFTARDVRLQPNGSEHDAATATERLEVGLMIVSSVVALGGIGFAVFLFQSRRSAVRALAERFSGLHLLLLHKYYVDEIYDATVVQPIKIVSEEGLWKIVDVRWIDGVVNGVGETVSGASELLRRLQTGSVRAYAASLFFGVVAILGYYLWR